MGKLRELRYLNKTPKGRWIFDPPQEAIDAGVVRRRHFTDGRRALGEVPPLIERVDLWREGKLAPVNITPRATIKQLIANYTDSEHFQSLSPSTHLMYSVGFKKIANTPIGNKLAGDYRLEKINGVFCQKLYDGFTNDKENTVRCFSVLMSYAISLDALTHNPMAKIKKVKKEKRSVVWDRDQIVRFLDECFSDFRYRSVGLIAIMCYEWMQRPTDIRTLKWDVINWEKRSCTIIQSKRGAVVELPIDDGLLELLQQQKDDFGFQEYVVPHLRASDKAWRPYTRGQLSNLVNEVLDKAGLPRELRMGDFRKTGIMEAVEADVPITSLMSVTGHKNLTSLTPYVKPSFKAAVSALSKRKSYRDG